MTPAAIRDALAQLDMTQTGLAALFGRDGRTVRSWVARTKAAKRAAINPEAAILLRLMLSGKISQEDIERARK